jgi:penicillin-binding protein 2B
MSSWTTLHAALGLSVDYAKKKLKALDVHKIYIGNGNMVVDQYPKSNELTSTNQNVFIKTNSDNITLPNMVKWSYKDVMIYKEMSGLNIICNGDGVVKKQSVAAKTKVTSDMEIIVTLE